MKVNILSNYIEKNQGDTFLNLNLVFIIKILQ